MRALALLAVLLWLAPLALPLPQGEGQERPLTGPGLYENAQEGQWVELRGRVRLVGHEPFPELVLTGEDGEDWFIPPEEGPLIAPYEQRTLTVRGRVKLQERVLANGQRLESRRLLLNITLVQ